MRFRLLILALALIAASSVGVVLSQRQPHTHEAERQPAGGTAALTQGLVSGHDDMGPHMKMTSARPASADDERRAEAVAAVARRAIEKYRDYKVALRDGYEILAPGVPQPMYHFNNAAYYGEAERRFDPAHPTSLLYEKAGGGFRLIGVMYTAPAEASEAELDARIPLSVARWHQHVNVCLPQGDPLQKLFGQGGEFGLDGSIATQAECARAGGQFIPRLFGWMVHLYPYERTAAEMWSVQRQMTPGMEHMH